MRLIGSEKLPVGQKVKRIMEIANYSRNSEVTNKSDETEKNKNVEYTIKSSNGKIYSVIKEHTTYVIKEGNTVNSLDYIGGLHNSNTNRFKSYSSALKRLNLIISESNRLSGNEKGLSLYGEQTDDSKWKLVPDKIRKAMLNDLSKIDKEELQKTLNNMTDEQREWLDEMMDNAMKKYVDRMLNNLNEQDDEQFVLKTNDSEEVDDFGSEEGKDEGGEDEMDFDMDVEDEGGEDEMDFDMEVSGEDGDEGGPVPIKAIQKLTGKLGQKMREVEDEMDSSA